jgi:salicylate hydroxylase
VQTLWLGPGRHFVHYPISAGRLVNVVAIVPAGHWRNESWTADGEISDLSAEFEGWDHRVQQLIRSAASTKRWAMYDRDPLERWSEGPHHPPRRRRARDAAVLCAGCGAGDRGRRRACRLPAESRRGFGTAGSAALRGDPSAANEPGATDEPRQGGAKPPSGRSGAGTARPRVASGDPLRQSAWLYGHDAERVDNPLSNP